MKHVRFARDGKTLSGVWDDAAGKIVSDAGAFAADEVTWLPPSEPTKVVGTVLTYLDHADELGLERPREPILFLKPVTSLIGHRGKVRFPKDATYMHYEVELAVVIGRPCKDVGEREALDFVAGYTIANDVTVRDYITDTFRPPVKAKGWDTFGPLGPFLVDRDDVPDVGNLTLRAFVNGELRQEGTTRQLAFSVPRIISDISQVMTLLPGDVILTGTPKGLSHIYPGDVMRLEIDHLGVLENEVVGGSRP